ncbi:unnamed protein product [Arabidopsis halleri]
MLLLTEKGGKSQAQKKIFEFHTDSGGFLDAYKEPSHSALVVAVVEDEVVVAATGSIEVVADGASSIVVVADGAGSIVIVVDAAGSNVTVADASALAKLHWWEWVN